MEWSRIRQVHLVGIGGVGMGGLARLLLQRGIEVTGSDAAENDIIRELGPQGARIGIGHCASHLETPDCVVVSSAIEQDNPERKEAMCRAIPIMPRAQMLSALMNNYRSIAVSGTHGKTTTTALVRACLEAGGLNPSYSVGGRCLNTGQLAELTEGRYFVIEADESDASFLYFSPEIVVITNIDEDHMETYEGDFDRLKSAFRQFIHSVPKHGLAVLCLDDPEIRTLLPMLTCPVLTYGFSEDADIRATTIQQEGLASHFRVSYKRNTQQSSCGPTSLTLTLPGRHNVQNALAAIAVAHHLGVKPDAISQALSSFKGVGRRCDVYGDFTTQQGHRVTLVNDYGHHPCEVEATVEGLRSAWPHRRLLLVFQPHRYSRLKRLMDAFVSPLAGADQLVLLPIYSAGENPIKGVSTRHLADKIQKRLGRDIHCLETVDNSILSTTLDNVLCHGDVVLFQGAGSVGSMARHLAEQVWSAA